MAAQLSEQQVNFVGYLVRDGSSQTEAARRAVPHPAAQTARAGSSLSELVTPIGVLRLGDTLEARWIESGGDGEFYAATVVALSANGATVAYPETADWKEWREHLALEDCELKQSPLPAENSAASSRLLQVSSH